MVKVDVMWSKGGCNVVKGWMYWVSSGRNHRPAVRATVIRGHYIGSVPLSLL